MWNKLGLDDWINDVLIKKGFQIPTQIQNDAIPSILDGKDVVGGSKTGSGKTFAFGLPALQKVDVLEKGVQVLILCPTRELAMQVCDSLREIADGKEGLKIVPVYGGADFYRQLGAIKKGAKIIVGTTGRVLDHIDRRSIRLNNLKMLILDEADLMLDMGFKPDIDKIINQIKNPVQKLLFSATMPKQIKDMISSYLVEPIMVSVGEQNVTCDNVSQFYVRVGAKDKKQTLITLIDGFNGEQALIFCNTKQMTEDVDKFLYANGVQSKCLNGDMKQNDRKKVLEEFKNGLLQVLVCTDVASRGIDINNLNYVINFDIPYDYELYIHRIGRTGRAEKTGVSYTILNKKEQLNMLCDIARKTKSQINECEIDGTTKFDSIMISATKQVYGKLEKKEKRKDVKHNEKKVSKEKVTLSKFSKTNAKKGGKSQNKFARNKKNQRFDNFSKTTKNNKKNMFSKGGKRK